MRKHLPLVLLLGFALLLAACGKSRHISSPQSAANDFLQMIGESRFQEAYASTAFAFKAQTDFRSFQATARELGLSTGTIACKWVNVEPKHRETQLTGELLSANGATIPLRLTLTQERGEWRIFALLTPSQGRRQKEEDRFSSMGKGDSFNSSANHEIPPLKTLRNLTLSSLLLLNDAARQSDFSDFYSKVSLSWQNQLTLNQLKEAFQPFTDSRADISGIQKLQPIFDVPPTVDTEGILNLVGHYETKPYRTTFALRFIYEFPYWKLYGINVQLQG